MVVVTTNPSEEMRAFGYAIKDGYADHFTLVHQQTENEVMVWKLGEWLQFRCRIVPLGEGVGSKSYVSLSETINRLHELAIGARLVVADNGDVSFVTDILHSVSDASIIATTADQLLYLSNLFHDPICKIKESGTSLSADELDRLFE